MDEQDSRDFLREISDNTKSIVAWLQLAHGDVLRQRLEKTLDSPSKRTAYENSDGAHSTREIAKLVGVGDKAIRQWWQDWALLGIVEETAMPGRFRRRFNPKEVGMK